MLPLRLRPLARLAPRRGVSTLADNPSIYTHPLSSNTYRLSLLPTPTPSLSLGTTTALPPTPTTFTENPDFLPLLRRILSRIAHLDPYVQADALAFASSGGTSFTVAPRRRQRDEPTGVQGGAGGAGIGGYVHVYDQRQVPAFGRIPEPQDIFGSLLVDGRGAIVAGSWEGNSAYRLVTGGGGVMRLSPWLAERVRAELEKVQRGEAAADVDSK